MLPPGANPENYYGQHDPIVLTPPFVTDRQDIMMVVDPVEGRMNHSGAITYKGTLTKAVRVDYNGSVYHQPIGARVLFTQRPGADIDFTYIYLKDPPIPGPPPVVGGRRNMKRKTKRSRYSNRKSRKNSARLYRL
jgi:hypothetical protein